MSLGFFSDTLVIQTKKTFEYLDITQKIRSEVKDRKLINGIVLVNVLHTTAAVVIQEADQTVHEDAMNVLERLIPSSTPYAHSYEGTLNGSAHQRQQILGNSCILPVKDSDVVLGTWQRVFLMELFRPMNRRVQITILGFFRKE